MRINLKKARGVWVPVSCMLRAENASPRVCGVFHKAMVHMVLLFQNETWKLSPLAMKSRRMTGMVPKRGANGTWVYPLLKDASEVVGLYMIKEYIEVRHQNIASFIVNRPIFNQCQRGVRRRAVRSQILGPPVQPHT